MPDSAQRVVFTLTCADSSGCLVSFEPEGAEHTLPANDEFRVEMEGAGSGIVDITHLPGRLIVGAWSGADTRVWNRAGVELAT